MTEHSSITAALAAFHLDVSTIEKTARAQYGQFADLSTVLSAVTPALSRNGLALVQTLDTEGDDDVLCTTLYHTSGQHVFSPLHLWGSSVTYQRRFCALALLGLAAGMEDDDGDSAGPARQAKKPAAKSKPRELAPFEGVEDALKILDKLTTPKDLAMWVARLKASSLNDEQVAELRDSYAEHQARLQEQEA